MTAPGENKNGGVLLAAIQDVGGRYRWAVWVLVVFFVALGFDFKTPAHHFRELEAQVKQGAEDRIAAEALLRTAIQRGDSLREDMRGLVRALIIGQCLDRPRTESIRMGLPCRALEAEPVAKVHP